jgi:LEA14-like dessication related protein
MHLQSLVVFLVAATVVVAGCSMPLKVPEVTVTGVSPRSVSLTELALDVTLHVDNPNPVGMNLKTLSFDVSFQQGDDWVHLAHGEQDGIALQPGPNDFIIPVTVQNSALLGSLRGIIQAGEITLKIEGTARPDFRLFAPEVPFSRTMTLSR